MSLETQPATLNVFLVRHGETDRNVDARRIVGRSDHVPINANGAGQATATGFKLAAHGVEPEAVYCSPAIRTRQTAAASLMAMGWQLEPLIDKRLHEINMGSWEGKDRNLIYDDAIVATILRDPVHFKAPEGESIKEVAERGRALFKDFADRHYKPDTTSSILAFTHGMATRVWVGDLLGWTTEEIRQAARTPNASVTLLSFEPMRQWHVEYVGKTALARVP